METSSPEQKKPYYKRSQIIPSNFHLDQRTYAGHVCIGEDHHFTSWFSSKDEAELELRCLEKQLNFELIKTVEDEGCHPERAKLIEEAYQASGRTNSLYTALMYKDGEVSNSTTS
jgi:hypothetical protein